MFADLVEMNRMVGPNIFLPSLMISPVCLGFSVLNINYTPRSLFADFFIMLKEYSNNRLRIFSVIMVVNISVMN
jgi:hypothetical protein